MARTEYPIDILYSDYIGQTYIIGADNPNDTTIASIAADTGTFYYPIHPLHTTTTADKNIEFVPFKDGLFMAWRLSLVPEWITLPAGDFTVNCYVDIVPGYTAEITCRIYKCVDAIPTASSTLDSLGEGSTAIVANNVAVTVTVAETALKNEYLFLVANIKVVNPTEGDIAFRCHDSSVSVVFPLGVPDYAITDAEVSVVNTPAFTGTPVPQTSVSVNAYPAVEAGSIAGKTTDAEVETGIVLGFDDFIVATTSAEISIIPVLAFTDFVFGLTEAEVNAYPALAFSHYPVPVTKVEVSCIPALTFSDLAGAYGDYTVSATPTVEYEAMTETPIVVNGTRIDNRTISRGGFYKRR